MSTCTTCQQQQKRHERRMQPCRRCASEHIALAKQALTQPGLRARCEAVWHLGAAAARVAGEAHDELVVARRLLQLDNVAPDWGRLLFLIEGAKPCK